VTPKKAGHFLSCQLRREVGGAARRPPQRIVSVNTPSPIRHQIVTLKLALEAACTAM